MDVVLKPGQSIRPIISEKEAMILADKLFGLKCISIIALNGYDDKNYRIQADEIIDNDHMSDLQEEGYVLKILNSLDSEKLDFIQAQNELLLYCNKKGTTCPVPMPTKNGGYFAVETLSSGIHVVRLMKFISGITLYQVPFTNSLFYQIGGYAAKLDGEMMNFRSEAYEKHKTLWMLDSVCELRKFLFAINDKSRIEIVSNVIDNFEAMVLNRINEFERGLIHGDFNEQNILVEEVDMKWKMKGILDFGDSHISCYMFELAIMLAYMMILGGSVEVGGHVIAGYHEVRKIPRKEFELLKICVEARLCQSLVVGAYSSMQDPGNDYILTTSKPGWKMLSDLTSKTNKEVLKTWATTAAQYHNNFEFADHIDNNR